MSLVWAVSSDIDMHQGWISVVEANADVVLTMQPLPVGKAADLNFGLGVFRPNRWGSAAKNGQAGSIELHSQLRGCMTDRKVTFHA
jgi:hypothetical protein